MKIQSFRIMMLVLIGALFLTAASVYAETGEEYYLRTGNAYLIKQGILSQATSVKQDSSAPATADRTKGIEAAREYFQQGATITISGIANRYDKVSLFKNGSATIPLKTESVSAGTGEYTITINIPGDMIQDQDYYLVDMRFWKDMNNNNIKEPEEPCSECNFIIWHPEKEKVYLKVYGGSTYEITSSNFTYSPR